MRYAVIFLVLALALGGCVSAKRLQREGPGAENAGFGKPVDERAARAADEEPEVDERAARAAGSVGRSSAKEEPPLTRVEVEEYTESILSVIESLEECYGTGDFEKWKSLLTPLYKEKHDDSAYLRAQGWAAADLGAFFRLLIKTRRRGNVTALDISRVEFVNPRKALVFVILDKNEFPEPQHTFIRAGNSWLKGLPEEGE
jgi:hypothetical protein